MRHNAGSTDSFVAVLDSDGLMVESYSDADEAYEHAEQLSPTGTVAVDASVYAAPDKTQNPPTAKLKKAPSTALELSNIEPVHVDWAKFDPFSDEGKQDVRDARAELKERGRAFYERLVSDVAGLVHRPAEARETKRRGGIAAEFNDRWMTEDLLRQNQKMAKVLEGSSLEYDSIGLSLLPHGASFREPFSTSTDQGAGGATYCAFSSPECRKVCLVNTGQRALESGAFAAGYLFSHLMREAPAAFLANLFDRCVKEFSKAHAAGFGRFIRLNVLSDLPWELMAPGFIEAVCDYARETAGVARRRRWKMADGFAFYDYTKIPYRVGVPGYYDLTYSFSGSKNTFPAVFDVLEGDRSSARRVAVVFVKREEKVLKQTKSHYRRSPGKQLSSEEPYHAWTFLGHDVWNGDLSDVRPLDPGDVRVVGLTYKPPHYKVAPQQKGKQYGLLPVVPSERLDKELPTFLVRVMQPDPDAPPIVVATQDPDNRKLVLPTWKETP